MEQAAPIDEKAIRDTYAFAEAFGGLSQSMAELGAVIQSQRNKENLEGGARMVMSSQKTYKQLEEEGLIHSSENPWQAIGAARASGIMEASRSEVELRDLVSKAASENPSFYDDSTHFDALVSQYASNKSQAFSGNKYLTDSFFENFNPVVVRLQRDNFDSIEEARMSKVLGAASSKVQMGVSAISGLMGPEKSANINPELENIQRTFDEQVSTSGGRAGEVTRAYAISLIEIMRSDPENSEEAELVLRSLKTGTGKLFDTSVVQNLMAKHGQEISATREKATSVELRAIFDKQRELLENYQKGIYGSGPEAHTKVVDELDAFFESSAISVSAGKNDEERGYLYSKVQDFDEAAAKAKENAVKEAIKLDEQQQSQLKSQREERASGMMVGLRGQIREGSISPGEANDAFQTFLMNPNNGFTFEERLKYSKSSEEDFNGQKKSYDDAVATQKTRTAEVNIVNRMSRDLTFFVRDSLTNPQSVARPIDIAGLYLEASQQWRDAGLTEDQRTQANDRMYGQARVSVRAGLDAMLLRSSANGGIAPMDLTDLNPAPADTAEVRQYKSNARAIQYDAMASLDETFGEEDTIAYFKHVANTRLSPEIIERGVPSEVEDLYRLWKSSKSGYFREKMFANTAGERLNQLFMQVDSMQGMSFQDALADALSTYQGNIGASLLDWTNIQNVQSGDRQKFENYQRSFIEDKGITHPDSRRLIEGLYGAEVVRLFNTSQSNPLNLSMAIRDASTALSDRIITFGGSFMFKQGNIGIGSYTSEHFRNLAKFYAPNADEPVFYPVSQQANGEYIYALRDKEGNIVQDRLFTVYELADGDALSRAVFYEKTGKSEVDWASSKGIKFIDYSATAEAKNKRLRDLLSEESQ
jgi:hypothetical protein